MSKPYFTLPRLHISESLTKHSVITLGKEQSHYLRNVLRRKQGDMVRFFNGRDGEWLAEINTENKKSLSATPSEQIKPQPQTNERIHLFFAPLKKNRMDLVIEKCTELGVTDFHPVLTERTEIRKLKEERLLAQIIEATEQCERMVLPRFHKMVSLSLAVQNWSGEESILWGAERGGGEPLASIRKRQEWAFLIGPVGGFSENEESFLAAQKSIQPISLGPAVYRAETASIICSSHARLTLDLGALFQ